MPFMRAREASERTKPINVPSRVREGRQQFARGGLSPLTHLAQRGNTHYGPLVAVFLRWRVRPPTYAAALRCLAGATLLCASREHGAKPRHTCVNDHGMRGGERVLTVRALSAQAGGRQGHGRRHLRVLRKGECAASLGPTRALTSSICAGALRYRRCRRRRRRPPSARDEQLESRLTNHVLAAGGASTVNIIEYASTCT